MGGTNDRPSRTNSPEGEPENQQRGENPRRSLDVVRIVTEEKQSHRLGLDKPAGQTQTREGYESLQQRGGNFKDDGFAAMIDQIGNLKEGQARLEYDRWIERYTSPNTNLRKTMEEYKEKYFKNKAEGS